MLLQSLLIGEENDFKGVVDLVRNQAIVWDEEGLGSNLRDCAYSNMLDEVKEYRSILIEQLLIMMRLCLKKFMEDENSITEEEINIASCCNGYGYHSYDCWFFFQNKGVQFMLDAVCKYLPSQWIKKVLKGFILMMLNY
jgi:elongation factor G